MEAYALKWFSLESFNPVLSLHSIFTNAISKILTFMNYFHAPHSLMGWNVLFPLPWAKEYLQGMKTVRFILGFYLRLPDLKNHWSRGGSKTLNTQTLSGPCDVTKRSNLRHHPHQAPFHGCLFHSLLKEHYPQALSLLLYLIRSTRNFQLLLLLRSILAAIYPAE